MRMSVVIIGCGAAGRQHADALRDHPDAELVAVADLDSTRARVLADATGCTRVGVDEALERYPTRCVAICTPPSNHVVSAERALRAGRAVMVEKPVAMRSADVHGLLDVVRQTRKPVAVMHQHRFVLPEAVWGASWSSQASASVEVVRYRPGELYRRGTWKGRPGEGGIFAHLAVHWVDLLFQLFRSEATLTCDVSCDAIAGVDSRVIGMLRFKAGQVASLHVSANGHIRHGRLWVTDAERTLEVDIGGFRLDGRTVPAPTVLELRRAVYSELAGAVRDGTILRRSGLARALGSVRATEIVEAAKEGCR